MFKSLPIAAACKSLMCSTVRPSYALSRAMTVTFSVRSSILSFAAELNKMAAATTAAISATIVKRQPKLPPFFCSGAKI